MERRREDSGEGGSMVGRGEEMVGEGGRMV